MTEAVHEAGTAPLAPSAPEGDPNPSPAPTEPVEASDDVASLRREAAGYRRQLRTVEQERDALREQLDNRDRADAERLAGETLASGADLWVGGVGLEQLRDDTGALSTELVAQAVERVLGERPHWRKRLAGSFDGGARTPAPTAAPSFGEALKRGQH